MSLLLEPDEIKELTRKPINNLYPDPNTVWGRKMLYDAIAHAQCEKAGRRIRQFYDAWHRGLTDTVACEQFCITYKVEYCLNFSTVLTCWLEKEGISLWH